MILSDLSPRKRHDTLWQALDSILQGLSEDVSTLDVAERLRRRLDIPHTEVPMVMTWLTRKAAPQVPEASQTGPVVKAYGRYGRRWVWSPRGSKAPVVRSGLEARLNEAGVVDTTDW